MLPISSTPPPFSGPSPLANPMPLAYVNATVFRALRGVDAGEPIGIGHLASAEVNIARVVGCRFGCWPLMTTADSWDTLVVVAGQRFWVPGLLTARTE